MEIIKATISEIDNLSPVFHEYRGISISREEVTSIEDSKTWLHDRIQNGQAVFFNVVDEGQIVGFSTLYQGFSSISLKKYWILNDLYVIPSYRNRGCAKLLISYILKYAVTSGSKGVELETSYSNKHAQTLYENFGFKENKLYKNYFWSVDQKLKQSGFS